MFDTLEIPNTLAAGPGPGNTDPQVLASFTRCGVADHMQADVLRGMREAKFMLRELFGTQNTYTFGVGGTGWSGIDCMMSAVLPGDKVVAFVNGTFSGIDDLAIRMRASSRADLAASPDNPKPANVITINVAHGESVTGAVIEAALAEHQPKWAIMTHWETGSGRINDIEGFSRACEQHGVMGLVDAVSSLGVADFAIDDYPGVAAWASCPQKGVLCLPLTYAPVSFTAQYIASLKASGCYSYVHHPILEARHWGIIDGQDSDTAVYHRTHSGYAIAAFHEALRILLNYGRAQKAADYCFYEYVLREAVETMGCKVTSNMSSLVVLNLPADFAGREQELVKRCRAEGFGIWPTLSAPVQIRIGILNQLNNTAITEIISRFGDALEAMGVPLNKAKVMAQLDQRLTIKMAA